MILLSHSGASEDGILGGDRVYLEGPVDLSSSNFDIGDLDYLVDSDEDGVGDLNEELAGTDPLNAHDTPGDVEIDVVAVYDNDYAELFEADAYTRIRHVMMVAEEIYRRSSTGIRLRLVDIPSDREVVHDHIGGYDFFREYGADIAVRFAGLSPGVCGGAGVPSASHGHIPPYGRARGATVYSVCGGTTTAHEIGHMMGLGHSYVQESVGIWRWSRGHYLPLNQGGTVMTYGGMLAPRFSDPDADCGGEPCGVDRDEPAGADAVASLNAVRFQVARYAEGKPDTDSDGFIDDKDAFPHDSGEWRDTDGDGVGNVADTDDDGDGASDSVDAFPLDPGETEDSDDDGVGDNADAFPTDPGETADTDGDGVGDNEDLYPDDPAESRDADGDGVGDNGDPFPNDPLEWSDADGDGLGDNGDPDADGDGVANAIDLFPIDPAKTDLGSFLIRGEVAPRSWRASDAGDIDKDGVADFIIHWREGIYLVSGADLRAADAADGIVDRAVDLRHVVSQPGSWQFVAPHRYYWLGSAVVDDWNGDGQADLAAVEGRRFQNGTTESRVYLVDGTSFSSLDAVDGIVDSVINLGNAPNAPGSWMLYDENEPDRSIALAIARDIDGSEQPRVVVSAGPRRQPSRPREVYVISSAGLADADAADGASDGVVRPAAAVGGDGSWHLVGADDDEDGGAVGAGDFDGDGIEELILGGRSSGHRVDRFYIVSGHRLPGADLADGEADGIVELSRIADGLGSWELVGGERRHTCCESWATVHENPDGSRNVVLGNESYTWVVSSADMGAADAADGVADGSAQLANMPLSGSAGYIGKPVWGVRDILDGDGLDFAIGQGFASGTVLFTSHDYGHAFLGHETWTMYSSDNAIRRVSSSGDVDGDGLSDLLIARRDDVLLLMASDFAALDGADGQSDGDLLASNLTLDDPDHDGYANTVDSDDDNDGVADFIDEFPLDADEWKDSDADGVGDNNDAFPRDRSEIRDTDADGVGDNADEDRDNDGIPNGEDAHPYDTDNDGIVNWDDPDDDNDGVADIDDELPLDPRESEDTDGDGLGNNSDPDDDNDGVADAADDLPLDPTETRDTDGDSVGDNADAYPNDAAEWADTDGDNVGDNADADDDNDGVPDSSDAFPFDAAESKDTDGDGVGDNADRFPRDATETEDFDGDGIGDNGDADDDNDGVSDADDLFPRLRTKSALTSYEFEAPRDWGGWHFDGGDGHLFMVAPGAYNDLFAIPVTQMAAADALDGQVDGSIDLDRVAVLDGSWKLMSGSPFQSLTVAHLGGYGRTVFTRLEGVLLDPIMAVFGDVASIDGADGNADGIVVMELAEHAGQAVTLTHGRHMEREFLLGRGDGVLFGIAVLRLLGGGESHGKIYVYDAPELLASLEDARDPRLRWFFEGENTGDQAGANVLLAGDRHVLISAPYHDVLYGDEGAIYLVPIAGDVIESDLGRVSKHEGGWKLLGESAGAQIHTLSAGDVDSDNLPDILVGLAASRAYPAAYLVSGASLPAADEADGIVDGVVALRNVAGLAGSYRFDGADLDGYQLSLPALMVDDMDADGIPDLLLGSSRWDSPWYSYRDYIVSGAQLGAADAADGQSDGSIALAHLAEQPGTWVVVNTSWGGAQDLGDLDGDGRPDLVFGKDEHAFFVSGGELPLLDAADGSADRVVDLNAIRALRLPGVGVKRQ